MNVPLDAPYLFAPGMYRGMSRTIVRVTTSDGVAGLGESPTPHDAALLRGELGERLVGRSPGDLKAELGTSIPMARTAARLPAGDVRRALVAVEMALWDIEARVAGVALSELIGPAVRSLVPVTEYFAFRLPGPAAQGESTPMEVAAFCARMVEEHDSRWFEGKVAARPLAEELRMVHEIRAAIGPERGLRIDANKGWRLETARLALRELQPLVLDNVEEPVGTLEELVELRRESDVPFSGHDVGVTPAYASELGVPDAFVLNVAACGGVSATLRFIAACDRAGVRFWFYGGDLGVGTACALQIAASIPSLDLPSQSLLRWYTEDVVVSGPFRPERGLVPLPTGPGLAVSLDERALARAVDRFASEGEYDLYEGPPLPRY